MGRDADSLVRLADQHVVARLVWFLSGNHPGLLAAAAVTMANLTCNDNALERLETLDAARLFWSLLKHPSAEVQAGAASAIAAFSRRSKVGSTSSNRHVVYHHICDLCYLSIVLRTNLTNPT